MKRTQFVVSGYHPLLLPVRDFLIQQGYALVPQEAVDSDLPVFLLFGAEPSTLAESSRLLGHEVSSWPTLLLSSSLVYSDRDHLLQQREIEPMDEANGHVITSPLDSKAFQPLSALMCEHRMCQRTQGKTIVVRPFNVYGPNIKSGLVYEYSQAIQYSHVLNISFPGRQIRTFLYEEDFFSCVAILVQKLLRGRRGIYNVGSAERIELLSLAKSIGHALNLDPRIELTEGGIRTPWWEVPAIQRVQVDTKWHPRITLRNGLFRFFGENR